MPKNYFYKRTNEMNNQDFTTIAKRYKETSIIQNSAADILLALLDIKTNESILDVGCGTGNLTKKLFDLSNGYVVGIDPSIGMIEESKRNYGKEIIFQVGSAEDVSFSNVFNVIFCNSAFQWFHDVQKSINSLYHALKSKGRVGIQAPAKKEYCPNFIQAIKAVETNNTIGSLYQNFKNPWFFLDTAKEYADMFLHLGFEVPFSEIQTIETFHFPEEVYSIFASGAAAGYLNQTNYSCEITNEYINEFQDVIRKEFNTQAKYDGKVKLVFNRIFLIAVKP